MSDQNDTTVDEPTTNEPTSAATSATSPTSAPTASATASDEADRTRRKVRTGVVVSEKMDKTVLVRIDRKVRHRLYKKTVAKSSKLAVHDETNDAHVGDTVRVMETRPLSKTKRWRVIEIVERAK
jgi:small subunit ribosomal protein S17